MSGHSKWSKVKHQKASTDAAKSAAFTKASRGITVAVREGGGITDPASNFKLRLAIENARSVNMPKDTIERAIERAKSSAENLTPFLYEGYGPGGVAVIVEGVTDNKQRTASQVKHVFDSNNGSLGGPGAVLFQFQRVGAIELPVASTDSLFEKALAAGAIDIEDLEGESVVYTKDTILHEVSQKLAEAGLPVAAQKIIYHPNEHIPVEDAIGEKVVALRDALLELDDVSEVYTTL